MEVEIRKAAPEDAAAVAELATDLGYSSSVADVSQRLSDTLCRDDHMVAVAGLRQTTAQRVEFHGLLH